MSDYWSHPGVDTRDYECLTVDCAGRRQWDEDLCPECRDEFDRSLTVTMIQGIRKASEARAAAGLTPEFRVSSTSIAVITDHLIESGWPATRPDESIEELIEERDVARRRADREARDAAALRRVAEERDALRRELDELKEKA